MSNKKDQPFEIPKAILDQLNECTLAFTLTYVNDQGSPCIISRSDNFSFFLAMQSHLENWIAATKQVAIDNNCAEMTGESEEVDEDQD